jgi:hypothetical protein
MDGTPLLDAFWRFRDFGLFYRIPFASRDRVSQAARRMVLGESEAPSTTAAGRVGRGLFAQAGPVLLEGGPGSSRTTPLPHAAGTAAAHPGARPGSAAHRLPGWSRRGGDTLDEPVPHGRGSAGRNVGAAPGVGGCFRGQSGRRNPESGAEPAPRPGFSIRWGCSGRLVRWTGAGHTEPLRTTCGQVLLPVIGLLHATWGVLHAH